MLEILFLYFLCKKMGSVLRDKGWNTTVWMQLLVIVAWFGSMFFAGIAYGIYLAMTGNAAAAQNPNLVVLYPLCFLGGGVGVGLVFALVSFFPSHDLPQ